MTQKTNGYQILGWYQGKRLEQSKHLGKNITVAIGDSKVVLKYYSDL